MALAITDEDISTFDLVVSAGDIGLLLDRVRVVAPCLDSASDEVVAAARAILIGALQRESDRIRAGGSRGVQRTQQAAGPFGLTEQTTTYVGSGLLWNSEWERIAALCGAAAHPRGAFPRPDNYGRIFGTPGH